MKLKDYIFYRMYCIYKKNNEFARVSAIAYLSAIDFFLILPFIFICAAGFNIKGNSAYLITVLPGVILIILNCLGYFNKNRLNSLIRKYNRSKYNRTIKNWMLYSIIFIAMVWGILGMFPIGHAMMWFFK
ncbi:MAG TPA: hypothetical protein DIT04_06160 [Dysgonomonas sp.]|nr:hypothetical protein [Dysgonomonas sp.]